MSRTRRFAVVLMPILLLGACATFPGGPSMMSLPGTGKNFDEFRVDDAGCRQYAVVQAGGKSPNEAANSSGVQGAVVGTAVGAAADFHQREFAHHGIIVGVIGTADYIDELAHLADNLFEHAGIAAETDGHAGEFSIHGR